MSKSAITVELDPEPSGGVVLADQVTTCPPHWWRVEGETETCKKCGLTRPNPALSLAMARP